MVAKLSIRESPGQQTKDEQRTEHRQHHWIGKLQATRALAVDRCRLGQFIKLILAKGWIMIELLDVQKTSVGGKGHLPQSGKILDLAADAEIPRVVHGGFGTDGASLLEVLLDGGRFVVNPQAGDHA